MDEEQRYLYHCDRCGELFKSKRCAQEDIRCESCGEHPVRAKFAAVTDMPALDERDKKSTHGKPGKDKADIFMMRRKRQRIKWAIIGCVWVTGLVAVTLVTNRMHKKAARAAKTNTELSKEDKDYLARKNEAIQKCRERFILFATKNVVQSKSAHILNGSDLVLDIKRYYSGNLMKYGLAKSRMVSFNLIENDKYSKAVALYIYQPVKNQSEKDQKTEPYEFEVLFWKEGKNWLIDWPHFVRLGDMNWYRFSKNKNISSPKRFRLYAREPSTESLDINGFKEYKFSEPLNNSNLHSQLEELVLVESKSELRNTLANRFKEQEKLREKKVNSHDVIGSFGPRRAIKVDVTVDFKEIEGNTVMVLKEIHALNWETPPSKKIKGTSGN